MQYQTKQPWSVLILTQHWSCHMQILFFYLQHNLHVKSWYSPKSLFWRSLIATYRQFYIQQFSDSSGNFSPNGAGIHPPLNSMLDVSMFIYIRMQCTYLSRLLSDISAPFFVLLVCSWDIFTSMFFLLPPPLSSLSYLNFSATVPFLCAPPNHWASLKDVTPLPVQYELRFFSTQPRQLSEHHPEGTTQLHDT